MRFGVVDSLRRAARAGARLVAAAALVVLSIPAAQAQADPRIAALASQLANDPAAMYAYVRDNVGIDLYPGNLRGARGTLASKAANALDRASLLVDLLRAAGYTARYVQGTLSDADARKVVARMFPDARRFLGCFNDGGIYDVLNDGSLMQYARAHTWVEYKPSAAAPFTALDTIFPGTAAGTTFAAPATTFDAIPDAQRHTVRFRVVAETYSQAGAMYGFGLGTATVLDRSFATADLVDKPVTFSHFVAQQTLPGLAIVASTNTYSPYLMVGDGTKDPRDYEVVRGTDYAETLTNFPLGSTLLTGVFVEIDVAEPGAAIRTYRRTLVDRVGPAVRATGGPIAYNPTPDAGPAVTPLDLLTVLVAPSKQPLDDFEARKARTTALQAEIAPLVGPVDALPAPDLMTPDDVALATRAVALNRAASVAALELAAASFEGAAGVATESTGSLYLVRPVLASPRITIARSVVAGNALQLSLDVRKNDLKGYPYPGITVRNIQHFERMRGLMESTLEGQVFKAITGLDAVTIASVFAAETDPTRYIPLTPWNAADVDDLAFSADAKARIKEALAGGRAVLSPRGPVTVGGKPVTAWLETDPNTGYTISTFEDGQHGALAEYAALYFHRFGEQGLENSMAKFIGNMNSLGVVSIAYMAGLITAIADNAEFHESVVTTKETLEEVLDTTLVPIIAYLKYTTAELELKGPYGQIYSMIDGLLEGIENAVRIIKLALGDPPVPSILFSPRDPPLPADTAPGGVPGVTLTLVPDPRFVLPDSGAELPTVYLATLRNTGPATDTFALFGASASSPFKERAPAPPVKLGPGQAAEFNVCLDPQAALPAAGDPGSVHLDYRSVSDPSVRVVVDMPFAVPAAKALVLRILPASASIAAGASVNATLTVDAPGNAAVVATLSSASSPGLSIAGLPPGVSLAAGGTQSLPVTFTVAPGTPSGSSLATLVHADFGGLGPATAAFAATVTSTLTTCTVAAALEANDLRRTAMGASLARLAGAMDALAAAPADPPKLQAVLAELDYLASWQLLAPYLAPFATSLGTLRGTLAGAAPGAVPGILGEIDAAICPLKAKLVEADPGDFGIGLEPGVAVNLPAQPVTVAVNIFNNAAQLRVFDLAIAGVPPEVSATFNANPITVPANYRTNGFQSPVLNVQFTNIDGQARAFDYTITATPRDQPGVSRTGAGQLVLRPDIVRIVKLTPTPAFGDPGTSISVAARLMNSINIARNVYGQWEARDRNGVLRRTGVTGTVTIHSGDGLVDLPPITVDTTGFPPGPATVTMGIIEAAACCSQLPGSQATASFLLGQPFSALLTVAPDTLPPGDGEVTLQLALSHDSLPTPAIELRSGIGLPAAARTIARSGDILYACQEDRVSIVDASDPDALAIVGTFATDLLGSAYANVGCNVFGSTLVLAYSLDSPTSFDRIKLVAFDIGGTNSTAPVQLNATPVDLGRAFGAAILVEGTSAWMPTAIYLYNPFSGFIFEQRGNLLALDFSTLAAPALAGELFEHTATPPGNVNDPVYGGPNMIFGLESAGGHLLAATTTSTGGSPETGVGRLAVVDKSGLPGNCPGSPNPCIVKTIDVPEARLLFGVAKQGTTAIAVGDTAGFYDGRSGLTGFLTVTAFDIADPANPVLKSTLVTGLRDNRPQNLCNANHDGGGTSLTALSDDFYAVGAFNPATCAWVLVLIDASDPASLRVIPYDVTDVLTATLLDGDLLYAMTRTGILVYDYAILTGPAITARVDVPKGNGVTLKPGTFSLAPTTIDTSAADRDRYTWEQPTATTITWQAQVAAMQIGETRDVALGGNVAFTLPAFGAGTLPINGVAVTSAQALSIAPTQQTVGLGKPATYTVTIVNPTGTPVSWTLAVDGLPAGFVQSLDSPVVVPANGQATATLVLQSTLADAGVAFPFTVTGTTGGVTGSVQALLVLNGFDRSFGNDDLRPAYGTAVAATPNPASVGRGGTVLVRLTATNTGTAMQGYYWQQGPLPAGWSVSVTPHVVDTAPDASTDFIAAIVVPADAAPGPYDVGLDLFSTAVFTIGRTTLRINVATAGVAVTLTPGSGTPATPFSATITNRGTATDTFDLSSLGALGPVIGFASNPVTLDAGASQPVAVTVGNAGYLPPGTASFDVQAISRADAAARAKASAQVTVPLIPGLALTAQPTSIAVPAAPASRSFALRVVNTGNGEDGYSLAITGTTGAITAALRNALGQQAQSLSPLRLPGNALGQFVLDATLNGGAVGTVTLVATSLSTPALTSTVTVQIQAAAAPDLQAAPNPQAFASRLVQTTSPAAAIVVTNSGDAPFNLGALAIGGSHPGDFALVAGAGACVANTPILANGGTCTLHVTFTPTAASARSASITLNDGGASLVVSLTGTGLAPQTCFTGPLPTGGSATACFTGGGPACEFAHAAFVPLTGDRLSPPEGSAPAGYTFPFGLFDFSTAGCTTVGTLAFTLTFPAALPARSVYYKYGPPGPNQPPAWFVLPATIDGATVRFSLPAGNIVDPGGPAFAALPPDTLAKPINVPTLSGSLLALLALAVAFLGLRARRL